MWGHLQIMLAMPNMSHSARYSSFMSAFPRLRSLRSVALAAALMSIAGVSAGCAPGSDETVESTVATPAPESVTVPMVDALAGLAAVDEAGAAAVAAATAGDYDAALVAYDQMHGEWEKVEGTVKDTDPGAYEAIETAQGLMRDGIESDNADRVGQGGRDQNDAITSFTDGNR